MEEPDVPSAVSILRGIKAKYEAHHGGMLYFSQILELFVSTNVFFGAINLCHTAVTITDGALVLAAKLAKRYIPGRKLPDSAIDLLDESASNIRVQLDSQPEIIDKLEVCPKTHPFELHILHCPLSMAFHALLCVQRKQLQLEVEQTALETELARDPAAKMRLDKCREELSECREELRPLKLRHEEEKSQVNAIRETQKKIEAIAGEKCCLYRFLCSAF